MLQGSPDASSASSDDDAAFVARWKTKVFAIECTRRILSVTTSPSTHFDLAQARQAKARSPDADFLVFSLPELIKMAFSTATSAVEALRPNGINLLNDLVHLFGPSGDPDDPGHSLLEPYQAQIASALRSALNAESPPLVTASACSVLVSYVTSPIMRDPKIVVKILNLLIGFIPRLQSLEFAGYSESAATVVQLSILAALADLWNSTESQHHNVIVANLSPQLASLLPLWFAALTDFAVLTTQNRTTVVKAHKGTFYTGPTAEEALPALQMAAYSILLATSALTGAQPSIQSKQFYLLLGIIVDTLSRRLTSQGTIAALKSLQALLSPTLLSGTLFEPVTHSTFIFFFFHFPIIEKLLIL
jgi:hypothetical protein